MLSAQDRSRIEDIAKRYGVGRVLLFGSSADEAADADDIDLAVEGLAPARFFAFYAELLFTLSKSVDLIDLDRSSKFTEIVRREGVTVYG